MIPSQLPEAGRSEFPASTVRTLPGEKSFVHLKNIFSPAKMGLADPPYPLHL